ncbi:UTRA domain-containing protein [Streptomyces sp. RLB3-6]|uniref:UTRA domain-containing protein n=1 Tax=Streptomyces sp. RLB3-6 TaxID=2594457 RepID=UPI001162A3B4|nr:UTRA domain-containing protein [Streptomyces sp. RLB3-6]QDN84348.1 UTRA domain-containing protein [Streptomyces sp. RLB3-6]
MPSTTTHSDGTILRDATNRYRRANREQGGAHGAFEGETRRTGGAPRAEVTVRRDTPPADVAELLGGDTSADVVVRARRMYDGERLVQLADTYIPADVAEAAGVEQVDTGVGGIISRMAEAGFAQAEILEDVAQHPASAAEAEALGVQSGDLLLIITHTGRTAEGRVVEVSRHILGPGWTLRFGVPVE